MDPAPATAAVREPAGRYGDLTSLARQALQPRVSRIETELRLNALQAAGVRTAETGSGPAPRPVVRAQPAAATRSTVRSDASQPARRGDPPPLRENPDYSLASFRNTAAPASTPTSTPAPPSTAVISTGSAPASTPASPPVPGAAVPAEKPTDPDGYRRALQDVQDELRSLRADIANLASTLAQAPPLTTPAAPSAPTLAATTPSPDLVPTASGMLQQHDPLSPGVQTRRFQARQVQQGVTPQQVAAAQDERINEQRLTVRQQELLRALQRAEQRLQDAPQDAVPPGLKDQVIGEILRAKYNVALFGGLGGAALTGWLTSAVA